MAWGRNSNPYPRDHNPMPYQLGYSHNGTGGSWTHNTSAMSITPEARVLPVELSVHLYHRNPDLFMQVNYYNFIIFFYTGLPLFTNAGRYASVDKYREVDMPVSTEVLYLSLANLRFQARMWVALAVVPPIFHVKHFVQQGLWFLSPPKT